MRCLRLVVGVVCLLLGVVALAQTDTGNKVKLRDVLDTRGVLLVKEYGELGEVKAEFGATVHFETLTVTVYGPQQQQVKGMLVTLTQPASKETTVATLAANEDDPADETSVYVYLDQDEIEPLSRAIPQLVDLAGKWDGLKGEHDAIITTRDDFSLSVSQFAGDQLTSMYGYDGDTVTAFFQTPQHLLTAKGYLDKGLRQLTAMK